MEHSTLIEAALVQYLQSILVAGVSPWIRPLDIYQGFNNLDKDNSRIVAYVDDLGNEDPPCSGNRWADVLVELRTPFFIGKVDMLAKHQANAGMLQSAILNTNLPDLLTSAIAGFTCFGITDRQNVGHEGENYWMSGWKITMLSCPAAFNN